MLSAQSRSSPDERREFEHKNNYWTRNPSICTHPKVKNQLSILGPRTSPHRHKKLAPEILAVEFPRVGENYCPCRHVKTNWKRLCREKNLDQSLLTSKRKHSKACASGKIWGHSPWSFANKIVLKRRFTFLWRQNRRNLSEPVAMELHAIKTTSSLKQWYPERCPWCLAILKARHYCMVVPPRTANFYIAEVNTTVDCTVQSYSMTLTRNTRTPLHTGLSYCTVYCSMKAGVKAKIVRLTWKRISITSFKMGNNPPWWIPTPRLSKGRMASTCARIAIRVQLVGDLHNTEICTLYTLHPSRGGWIGHELIDVDTSYIISPQRWCYTSHFSLNAEVKEPAHAKLRS